MIISRKSATLKAKTLSTGGYLIESSQYELQGLDAAASREQGSEEKQESRSGN